MRHLAEAFKVARILMHWYLNNPTKYSEDLVLCFCAFFELEVFVPEGMGKEVKSNIGSTAFEQPIDNALAEFERGGGWI